MPTKPTLDVRSATSQKDNRWTETVYDQHRSARFPRGRPWWGHLEYPADRRFDPAFCCELLPGDHNDPFNSVWSAPWLPSQVSSHLRTYFRLDVKKLSITWLYSTIIADDTAAILRYYQAAAKIAHEKGWPAPGLGEPVGFQIESILLEPPRSPKIAEAALAGDPWLLGATTQENTMLAELLAGIRPHTDSRAPLLSVDDVLSDAPDIDERIQAAVAAALAAQSATRRDRMAKVRGARGKKHRHASTAMPDRAA